MQGNWEKNRAHGHGTFVYADGRASYSGEWLHGRIAESKSDTGTLCTPTLRGTVGQCLDKLVTNICAAYR